MNLENQLSLHFTVHSAHFDEPKCVAVSPKKNCFVSIGAEDIMFQYGGKDKIERIELNKDQQEEYTTLIFHPTQDSIFYIGTNSGKVCKISNKDFSNCQLIYKGKHQIQGLSADNIFMIVTCNQDYAILINLETNNFIKIGTGKNGIYKSALIVRQYCCLIGTQGCIDIYQMSKQQNQMDQKESIKLLQTFKICTKFSLKQNGILKACQRPDMNIISVPGMNTLQEITLQSQPQFSLKMGIKHIEQIEHCKWINKQVIATVTNFQTIVWRQPNIKLFAFMNIFTGIYPILDTFFVMKKNSGNIFEFKHVDKISIQSKQDNKQFIAQQNEQQKIAEQKVINQQKLKYNLRKNKKKQKKKPNISKAAKIINTFPQVPLTTFYDQYMGNRYLFYNHIGTVVQRMQRQYPSVELQYHNKSKIQRIKFSSTNRNLRIFDLNEESFVYASGTHVYFENQKMNKENYKWEIKWHGIQGIALSNNWLAICGEDQIRILDIAGNLLHVISFSQSFITMDAYQDHLSVVYHEGPPIWGSSLFSVKVFKVDFTTVKEIKQMQMPITPNSELKWFGYSQYGALFSQDSEQTVRIYNQKGNSWVNVLKLQKQRKKLFIQTIHDDCIFGFMIDQIQGMPQQPTVMPKSLPRKIFLQGPYDRDTTDQTQNTIDSIAAQYRKLSLKKIIIQHQQYRNQQWLKFKYIRKRQHPLYQVTKSILSTTQIIESIKSFDANIIDIVRRYINTKEFQNQQNKSLKMKKIEFMCNQLLFDINSQKMLSKLLRETVPNQSYDIYFIKQTISHRNSIPNLNSLSNLPFLVADKQFLGRQIQ